MSQQSFAELGLSQPVVRALADRGMHSPFAIQSLVIEDVLDGCDVLAKSPTGSGKTIAFAAPIVDVLEPSARKPAALVLAPTRELAIQIAEEARDLVAARNLKVAVAYGGVGIGNQAKAARTAHLLVATPGRLLDLMARGAADLRNVEILVLDEADRMLDMGFRPDVDRIVSKIPRDRQTLFLSATLAGEAGRLAHEYTVDARRHEHKPPQRNIDAIEHRFVGVEHDAKVDRLIRELGQDDCEVSLVFVRTKRGADRLVKKLGARGVEAVALHGDKSQGQRERALARFEDGKVDVLVATDVAARGIDVVDVTHVVNFDAPEDQDGYVHRTGRTGRAGRDGVAITFVLGDQAREMGTIAKRLGLEFPPHTSADNGHAPARQGGGGGNRNRGRQRNNRR